METELRLLIEPVVGGEIGVAVILVQRRMPVVGAALGDDVYLCAGGAARLGIRAGRRDAEFLHRIERGTQHAIEGEACDLIVVVETVQRDVALVGACARDDAAAAVFIGLLRVVLGGLPSEIEHAGLQAKQVGDVAAFHRERLDRLAVDRVADGSVGRIEGFLDGRDIDDRGGGGAQCEVDGRGLRHE